MQKKLLIALCSLFACSLSYADTCPSVQDIKTNKLHGWKAYDSDEDTQLPPKRLAIFKKEVTQFVLAELGNEHNKNNTMRCYYSDSNGSHLETYLAKDHFSLSKSKSYWYQVSGSMHCAAGVDKCKFNPYVLSQNQLARK
ncbi:DUF3757 domain-containing protein [Aquicella lusitana]|uniref:Uncharacterized protein DUF3757 n=1 Tax=Aquicella lusitana TaxID=254246 RepID=A0A370GF08_9COXI|nr:DUF3757 domain-containing protein [Aquicella lusitana]RDI42398.1 uncharacterized protein DUF3757 [Aquicella lusitana]VVC74140.1 hypothetical protein AQULUS_19050 [Aquicella lusitana]